MSTAYHFWSPSCAPCRVIKPSIETLKEEFPDIEWVSVNTTEDTNDYIRKIGVTSWPTIVYFKNGVEVGRHSGTTIAMYYTLARRCLA
jgi:thioredoxin 1